MGKFTSLSVALFFALVAAAGLNCTFDPSGTAPAAFPPFGGVFQSNDARLLLTARRESDLLTGQLLLCLTPTPEQYALEGQADSEIHAAGSVTRLSSGDPQPLILLRDAANDTLIFQIGVNAPSVPLARTSPPISPCPL